VSKSPTGRYPFAKTVVGFAVAFMVGVGLCGVDYWLAAAGIGKSTEEFGVGPLDAASLIVMFFSAAGLVLTLIAWALNSFFSSVLSSGVKETPTAQLTHAEKVSQPEKRLHPADDTNIDKQD
jgi:hypothetical protein